MSYQDSGHRIFMKLFDISIPVIYIKIWFLAPVKTLDKPSSAVAVAGPSRAKRDEQLDLLFMYRK